LKLTLAQFLSLQFLLGAGNGGSIGGSGVEVSVNSKAADKRVRPTGE